MPYSIFQYACTAWGQSCPQGQAKTPTCPQGLSAQDLAQGKAKFCAGRSWSCSTGEPREGEYHPSMGRRRDMWSQWIHLLISFPPLVYQSLISSWSALTALHPHQDVQEGVCSPTHSCGPSPPQPVQHLPAAMGLPKCQCS